MDTQAIFLLQFLLSIIVFSFLMKWIASPWLNKQPLKTALFWLTLPHTFRHIGMSFLVPGLSLQTLPSNFAVPAAYGDLAAGILAFVALCFLYYKWPFALVIVWIFNIVGFIDLLNALRHAEVISMFGANWYIPTFLVPFLLVTHFMIFIRLIFNVNDGSE